MVLISVYGSGNIKTATGTIDAGTSLQTQEVAFTNDRNGVPQQVLLQVTDHMHLWLF